MKNRFVIVVAGAAAAMLCGAAGNDSRGPETLGAHWARVGDRVLGEYAADGVRSAWSAAAAEIMKHNVRAVSASGGTASAVQGTPHAAAGTGAAPLEVPAPGGGFSSGSTFIETPVSADQGIDRLTKSWTQSKLGRALFSTPGPTASYYTAHYMQGAPYVSATYVQFVVDPSWNRIVYGNMNAWIKSFNDLVGPTSIAVDPSGRVFVGESGRSRVTVLGLQGQGADAQLRVLFTLGPVTAPSAVAVSDNGTPLDPSDDVLYVADAAKGAVLKYSLGPTGGTLVATFGGFDSPTAVAAGRWNGSNNGIIYVVDRVAKRLQVLEDGGGTLTAVGEYRGGYDAYFSSLAVDHFGDVYVADNTSSRLLKLTSALEPLDEEGGSDMYAALAAVNVPFGLITVDGQGTYWAGFDQLFAVEQWTPASGARRRTLGLRLKDILFTTDENSSMIGGAFTLTGFGTVGALIYDASGNVVKTIAPAGMVSGRKQLAWDRRNDAGILVGPGDYRYELSATDPYRGETVTASSTWTLPLYYEEIGGVDDPHLVRGTPLHWGTFSASQDSRSVQYRFTGLNPTGTYAVSAEYVAPPDGSPRSQTLTAGGVTLHPPVAVGPSVTQTGFLTVPPAAFSTGELLLSVNGLDAGSAVISDLVLKETGRGFSSNPVDQTIPRAYALEQNYPNPFNPSTIIRYDLPEAGQVTLTVYDITGREITRLVNGVEDAGRHEVRFDGTGVRSGGIASGVYFYTVRAGSFTRTRKMVLLK